MKLLTLFLAVFAFILTSCNSNNSTPPVVLTPLPMVDKTFPSSLLAWNMENAVNTDEQIIKHDMWLHVPEGFGVYWEGWNMRFCSPSMSGRLDQRTIFNGQEMVDRLRFKNPNLKFLVQVGFTEGSDATTDFPPDHPWWLRVNGQRVLMNNQNPPPETNSYRFNLDLPEVRQHAADACATLLNTGIWDGIFLDVWEDDSNHLDILTRIRAAVGNGPIIMANCNYNICPLTIGLLDGIYMECGLINTASAWKKVQDALDYNERHVRQPAYNYLEITLADRTDETVMRATTSLALTRSNGYICAVAPKPTHFHDWYDFWNKSLGKPTSSTKAIGTLGSQREFENGTVAFNPLGGISFQITFPEVRLNLANGIRSLTHTLPPNDGGIYLYVK